MPGLISPENNGFQTDNTPTFKWTAVEDPSGVKYTLQYSIDQNFGPETITVEDLEENTYTVPSELLDSTYYWRVRAVDGAGNVGNWSAVWQFTVDTTPPPVQPR